jgi:hypothetical protein
MGHPMPFAPPVYMLIIEPIPTRSSNSNDMGVGALFHANARNSNNNRRRQTYVVISIACTWRWTNIYPITNGARINQNFSTGTITKRRSSLVFRLSLSFVAVAKGEGAHSMPCCPALFLSLPHSTASFYSRTKFVYLTLDWFLTVNETRLICKPASTITNHKLCHLFSPSFTHCQ